MQLNNNNSLEAAALSIRALSIDGVQAANSGHPGLPMGCADLGALLYGKVIKINPKVTDWINRDRFILSAGHGSMFLYSLLHLAGFDLSLEELKNFRQVGSKTPGHPEYGHTPGVETTTGPLGAGFSNGVGMAIAETMLSKKFNTKEHEVIDHYTYVLSGDGCLMEGISNEAASLAGHLGLGKLIVFYDSNKITIEGSTDITFTEDVAKRFESYGWQVLEGDAHNISEMEGLIEKAQKEKSKPTLIKLESTIGYGSPNKAGSHEVHGAPLGDDEVKATRKNLGIPEDKDFYIDPKADELFKARREEWVQQYNAWEKEFKSWKSNNPDLGKEWDDLFMPINEKLSEVKWPKYEVGDKIATRKANGEALNAAADSIISMIGGSADLAPSNNTELKGKEFYSASNRTGRNLNFGVREHAMGGIVNGLYLYGGLRPFCATFLVFSDYMRPAIRLSALMNLPVTYVFTHDSIFVGEDGPTHQPIEHVESLRNIPNLLVVRPGDAEETVEAWKLALSQTQRPVALILTRQNLEVYPKGDDWEERFAKGAYIVKDSQGTPEVVLIATGSEVNLALEAAKQSDKNIRVVSVPCKELFLELPETERKALIPVTAKKIVVEAGITSGWQGIAEDSANVIGIDRFGESGPGGEIALRLGLSVEQVLTKIK
jgi:transketolase